MTTAEEWAEIVWRLGGRAAMRLHIEGRAAGPPGRPEADPDRSAAALESARMLVNARGGDALERAEFARLFAMGEPQTGLRAFLARRKGMPVAEKT